MKKGMKTALVMAFGAALTLSACSSPVISEESKGALTEAENTLQDAVTTAVSGISDTAELFKSGQDNLDSIMEKVEKSYPGIEKSYPGIDKVFNAKPDEESAVSEAYMGEGILSDAADIELTDTDGAGKDYIFYYAGDEFKARYTKDNWKVVDSYKITNEQDITIICEALADEHSIPGSDGVSVRTAEDMAYEWIQHNIAYLILPDDNRFKDNARDVDINPEDQGKSFEEMYKDRTGKELTVDDIMNMIQSN